MIAAEMGSAAHGTVMAVEVLEKKLVEPLISISVIVESMIDVGAFDDHATEVDAVLSVVVKKQVNEVLISTEVSCSDVLPLVVPIGRAGRMQSLEIEQHLICAIVAAQNPADHHEVVTAGARLIRK